MPSACTPCVGAFRWCWSGGRLEWRLCGQGHALGPGMTFQSLGLLISKSGTSPLPGPDGPHPSLYCRSSCQGRGSVEGRGPRDWVGCGAGQRDKALSLWCPGLCTCGCCPAGTELLLHPPTPTPLLTRKDLGLGVPLAVNPFSTGRGWPPGQTPSLSLHWVLLVSTFLSP